jgi:hypothetical protein
MQVRFENNITLKTYRSDVKMQTLDSFDGDLFLYPTIEGILSQFLVTLQSAVCAELRIAEST